MIVSEIKETTSLFATLEFRHESRSSNGEALRLARSSVNREFGRHLGS
jgi:hypothetical protein